MAWVDAIDGRYWPGAGKDLIATRPDQRRTDLEHLHAGVAEAPHDLIIRLQHTVLWLLADAPLIEGRNAWRSWIDLPL